LRFPFQLKLGCFVIMNWFLH